MAPLPEKPVTSNLRDELIGTCMGEVMVAIGWGGGGCGCRPQPFISDEICKSQACVSAFLGDEGVKWFAQVRCCFD